MGYSDSLIQEFQLRYPDLADDAMSYTITGELELTVELYSRIAIYFALWNTVKIYNNDDLNDEEKIKEIFGFKVEYRLFIKSMTQEDLARKTDLSRVMINKYLTGKSSPTWSVVCRIADALNCPTDDLRLTF